jgi:transmembrane sensor
MSAPPSPDEPMLKAAAAWHARLNTRQVSSALLEEFRLWRQTPGARAAYAGVERAWRKAGRLEGDPQIDRAVRQALARGARQGRPSARAWPAARAPAVLGLAATGAIAALFLLAWPQLQGRGYATGVGEQRLIQLEDGSRVRLDTQTRLRVTLTPHLRQIRLMAGQAYFEVAHDPNRPLVVVAGGTKVRAIGTRFDVRRDDGQVRVTLVQGLVEVSQGLGPAAPVRLRAGQQLIAGRSIGAPTAADTAAATSWTLGRIVFNAVPLRTAVAEVNRYSRRQIILKAHGPDERAVTGVFDSGDTAAFLAAVRDLDGLKSQDLPDGAILLTDETGA